MWCMYVPCQTEWQAWRAARAALALYRHQLAATLTQLEWTTGLLPLHLRIMEGAAEEEREALAAPLRQAVENAATAASVSPRAAVAHAEAAAAAALAGAADAAAAQVVIDAAAVAAAPAGVPAAASAALAAAVAALQQFLQQPVDYQLVYDAFCSHDLVSGIKSNIQQFNRPVADADFKRVLGRCLAETRGDDIPVRHFDHRYFYVERGGERRIRSISGLVRRVAAEILDELGATVRLLTSPGFADSVRTEANPTVKGFLAERACLEGILFRGLEVQLHRTMGLAMAQLLVRPSRVVTFTTGREHEMLDEEHFCVLYVPRAFNYKHIDAVLRIRPALFKSALPKKKDQDKEEATVARAFAVSSADVLLVAVQVGIGANAIADHPHSVAGFGADHVKWLPQDVRGRLAAGTQPAPAIGVSFCWMVPVAQLATGWSALSIPGATLQVPARKQQAPRQVVMPIYEELRVGCEYITGEPHLLA